MAPKEEPKKGTDTFSKWRKGDGARDSPCSTSSRTGGVVETSPKTRRG